MLDFILGKDIAAYVRRHRGLRGMLRDRLGLGPAHLHAHLVLAQRHPQRGQGLDGSAGRAGRADARLSGANGRDARSTRRTRCHDLQRSGRSCWLSDESTEKRTARTPEWDERAGRPFHRADPVPRSARCHDLQRSGRSCWLSDESMEKRTVQTPERDERAGRPFHGSDCYATSPVRVRHRGSSDPALRLRSDSPPP